MAVKDAARFEAVASGVNKWIMSVALIISAAWALYTYRDVPRREDLKSQSNLVIEVHAEQLQVPGHSGLFVEGVVTVKNQGNRNTRLLFNPRGQVQITRLAFVDGRPSFETSDTASIFMWAGRAPESKTSLQGGVDYLPFVQQVQHPGLYLLSFSAERDPWDVDRAGGHGAGDRKLAWTGATYVSVAAIDTAANKRLQRTARARRPEVQGVRRKALE